MKNEVLLQRAMVVNRMFSAATIQRHAGLSKTFVYNKMKDYAEHGLIKRSGLGSNQEKLWRLTQEGKRRLDPNAPKEPVIQTLADGQKDLGKKYPKNRAEYLLWPAILELKTFDIETLLELNLANETTARQYIALLTRAGILNKTKVKETKRKQYEGCYRAQYSLAENPGENAPLMGRCFYLFNPNTGEYWATPMEGQKEDIINKRPGDADTSLSRPREQY